MKFGFVLPQGEGATAVSIAQELQNAGWDGFFMWEPVWGVDPWVALGAVAARTSRIRLGMLQISRRRNQLSPTTMNENVSSVPGVKCQGT